MNPDLVPVEAFDETGSSPKALPHPDRKGGVAKNFPNSKGKSK
jgi:hypothetical protein